MKWAQFRTWFSALTCALNRYIRADGSLPGASERALGATGIVRAFPAHRSVSGAPGVHANTPMEDSRPELVRVGQQVEVALKVAPSVEAPRTVERVTS